MGRGRAVILAAGIAALSVVPSAEARAPRARLAAFHSCDGLVGYARRHALETVGPRGVPVRPVPAPMPFPEGPPMMPSTPSAPGAAPVSAAPTAEAQPEAGVDYSETNVQEAGIDEPDIVKSDGSRIFAVSGAKLYAVDARASSPRLLGSLALDEGSGHELLLHGSRLLVISVSALAAPTPTPQTGASGAAAYPVMARTVTRIAEVDVSDPGAMRVLRTLRVDGSYVTARQRGATARVVISAPPKAFDFSVPAGPGPQARTESLKRNRARIRRARLSGWVPTALAARRGSRRRILRPAVSCRRVLRPMSFSGSGMLTVLTIDIDRGLPALDSDGLMTDAHTVYASAGTLYVATQRWMDPGVARQPGQGTTTSIHAFDISDPGRTEYLASGQVSGFLLNQFAMSEHRGFLRVASTDQPLWLGTGPQPQSESSVTVLERQGRGLVQVGKVGGLGRGQSIYAVRFIDDAAFVVTFRRIDPLYTIDLSTPARPQVLGELELLGYSAYLHPLGHGLLLGVGQDASEQGRLQGTQLSLFDVSDLRKPSRIAARAVGSASSSEVEYDHHAFLFWPPAKLAVVPVQIYADGFAGAVGFRVDPAAGIDEVGRVAHAAGRFGPPVRRALVAGGRLYTLSDGGIVASRLENLAEIGRVSFPTPAPPIVEPPGPLPPAPPR